MIDRNDKLEKAGFEYINSGGGCMVYQWNATEKNYIIITENPEEAGDGKDSFIVAYYTNEDLFCYEEYEDINDFICIFMEIKCDYTGCNNNADYISEGKNQTLYFCKDCAPDYIKKNEPSLFKKKFGYEYFKITKINQ